MMIQAIGKRGHAAILLLVSLLLELVACAPTSLPPAPQTRPSVTAAPTLIASRPAPPHPITAVVAPTPITAALPDAALLASRATIPILCYHQVRDWITADSPRDRVYIVPPARFAEQLDFLDQHGYHTISPDQLYNYLTNGVPLPTQPILISFDDATESQWTNALPLLRQHHFTATFFIMTVVLNKPRYLSRSQLQQLDQAGMTIGAHTWDHHPVTRYTDGDWEQQIVQPTAELASLIGHPIVYFAYPDGLWNAQAIAHLKAAGFVAAFQLDGALDASDPLFTIRRAIVNSQWQIAQFQRALSRLFAPGPAARATMTPTPLALPNPLSPPSP